MKMRVLSVLLVFVILGSSQAVADMTTYTAIDDFTAMVGTLSIDQFESLAPDLSDPWSFPTLNLVDFTMSSTNSRNFGVRTGGAPDGGPYPSPYVSGNYVLWFSNGGGTLTFDFASELTAFGVCLSDAADKGGAVISYSTNAGEAGVLTTQLPDASQVFFGLTTDSPFTQVTLHNTASGDGAGVDNVHYGTNVVPVPGAIILGGLGMGAAAGFLRRERRHLCSGR